MLLHVEPSRVHAPGASESGERPSRKDLLKKFTGREGATHDFPLVVMGKYNGENAQQLGDVGTNADTRLANAEELVDEGTESNEEGANNPDAECTSGRLRVIVIVDDSTNLGIGRVLDGALDLAYTGRIDLVLTTVMRAASTLSSL